jgi:hypothetical protein
MCVIGTFSCSSNLGIHGLLRYLTIIELCTLDSSLIPPDTGNIAVKCRDVGWDQASLDRVLNSVLPWVHQHEHHCILVVPCPQTGVDVTP